MNSNLSLIIFTRLLRLKVCVLLADEKLRSAVLVTVRCKAQRCYNCIVFIVRVCRAIQGT